MLNTLNPAIWNGELLAQSTLNSFLSGAAHELVKLSLMEVGVSFFECLHLMM